MFLEPWSYYSEFHKREYKFEIGDKMLIKQRSSGNYSIRVAPFVFVDIENINSDYDFCTVKIK